VGLPAPVDAVTGTVHAEGILPSWTGIVPAAKLEARLGMPVLVEMTPTRAHLFGSRHDLRAAGRRERDRDDPLHAGDRGVSRARRRGGAVGVAPTYAVNLLNRFLVR